VTTKIEMVKDSFINMSGALLYFFHLDTVFTNVYDTSLVFGEKLMTLTNAKGEYKFNESMLYGSSRLLKVDALETELHYINRFDVDLLTSYLIDPSTFTEPYQYLAADINQDKLINTEDLALLIGYLSGEVDDFGPRPWMALYMDEEIMANPEKTFEKAILELKLQNVVKEQKNINFQLIQLGDISKFFDEDEEGLQINQNTSNRSLDYTDQVLLMPNPCSDLCQIYITSNQTNTATLTLKNINGATLHNEQMQINKGNNLIPLNTTNLPEGVLLYEVMMNGEVYSGRAIKIK
jgi:hypothetical protein